MNRRKSLGPLQGFASVLTVLGLTGSAFAQGIAQYDAFVPEDARHHEFAIPTVVRAPNGDLLAFVERRQFAAGIHPDDGDNDIEMRRSIDGGKTWTDRKSLAGTSDYTSPDGVFYDRYNRYSNLVPVVDGVHGVVYVFYVLNFVKGQDRAVDFIKTRLFYRSSTDSGATWTRAVDATDSLAPEGVARTGYGSLMPGPAHGISVELDDGTTRLVVPFFFRRTGPNRRGQSFFYKQVAPTEGPWKTSHQVFEHGEQGTEVAVESLAGGSLYFNMRPRDAAAGHRVAAILDNTNAAATFWDTDKSWPRRARPELIDSGCQGSLLRVLSVDRGDPRNLLVFANPAHKSVRRFLTVYRALGESVTSVSWSRGKMLTDQFVAYSDMVRIDATTNGILYEVHDGVGAPSGRPVSKIVFTPFSTAWAEAAQIANWDFNEDVGDGDNLSGPVVNSESLAFAGTVEGRVVHHQGTAQFGATLGASDLELRKYGHSVGDIRVKDSESNGKFNFMAGETFEISARFKTDQHGGGGPSQAGAILAKDGGPGSPQWWLRVNDGKIEFFVEDGVVAHGVTNSRIVSDGEWHNVRARRDATSGKLSVSVDGVVEEVADSSGNLSNSRDVRIGNFNLAWHQFRGDFDYVRVSVFE